MESETQSLVSEINEHEPGSRKTYTEDGLVNEENRLLQTMVYKRRWYVMVVFCLSAMSQGGSWGIFGPISAAAEDAFGWKDSDIALLTAWGPIAYLISTFPFAWLIESKGNVYFLNV
jgi:anaerobic selenocysteine-containing dehydrogenase